MSQIIMTKPYWYSIDFKFTPHKGRRKKHSNYVDKSNKQLELKYPNLKDNKVIVLIKEQNK